MNQLHPFTLRRVTCACALSLLASCAFAQSDPGAQRFGPPPGAPFMGGPPRHEMMFLAGAQLERERVVQGAPYCADAVHETVQTLADGNRIVQRQTSRQCRDAQGRTRQEVAAAGRRNIYLRDPVAQEAWMLDAENKQAVQLHMTRLGTPLADMHEPKSWDRLIGWSRDLRDRMRLRPPEARDAPPSPPPMPARGAMPPPPVAFHARLLGPRGAGATTALPAETIDGLAADGKRTTWTIEAGRIGNEKPIVIVSEVWSSPELGITLRSRDTDPLAGEESFKVQNVVRGEPDAGLFRTPADFTKVSPQTLTMRGKP